MMKNFDLENVDCHAAPAMIEKRWGFPRRTLRALLGMTKNAQSGRSMIEMLGVLAIIGVLSVGGIAGYSKAMQKYRINKTIEQITLIAGNIRTFFGPQKNYLGLECAGINCDATNGCRGHSGVDSDGNPTYAENGCPIIKKAKILPDDMITVNDDGKITSITNPFGGIVSLVTENRATNGDNQAFYVLLRETPEEACIELVSQDWTASGVKGISIMNKDEDWYYLKVPATVDDVVTACPENYFIRFYFDIDLSSSLWSDFN